MIQETTPSASIKPTESLGELYPGHLYNVKGRQLIFTGKEIDKNSRNTKYKFIDIQMPDSLDPQSLLNTTISDFTDAIINPKECATTLLTSHLFDYTEETLLINVKSTEYYTISDDGTPIKSKEKDQSKAPQGPYYWRKTKDMYLITTNPTSASNIQAGAYNSSKVDKLYNYYMKKVPRI
jgi:hypothetical protein